jgi:hypothetical protein
MHGPITAISRQYIKLDLLVFPAIPSAPSLAAQDAALEIIKKHNLLDLGMEVTCPADLDLSRRMAFEKIAVDQLRFHHGRRESFTKLTELLQGWLACGIDNGVDWRAQFPERMQQSTATAENLLETTTLGGARSEQLADAAASLLGFFDVQSTKIDSTSAGMGPLLFPLTKFLTTILDPRIGALTSNPYLLHFTAPSPSNPDPELNSISRSDGAIQLPARLLAAPGSSSLPR